MKERATPLCGTIGVSRKAAAQQASFGLLGQYHQAGRGVAGPEEPASSLRQKFAAKALPAGNLQMPDCLDLVKGTQGRRWWAKSSSSDDSLPGSLVII